MKNKVILPAVAAMYFSGMKNPGASSKLDPQFRADYLF
jgi:hypothetical protein